MSAEENQLNVQGYNIVTILKRLETATSRLEDITMIQEQSYKQNANVTPSAKSAVSGSSAKSIEAAPVATSAVEEEEEKAKSTVKFEQYVEETVKPLVDFSKTIDSAVHQAAEELYKAFVAQAQFLDVVSKSKKPEMSDPNFLKAVTPTNEHIEKIGQIKDANRQSKFFNHLNTLAEGAPVLGWIVSDTPVSLIPEFKDSAQFWANRILKEHRDGDQTQVDWVKKFLAIFEPLTAYVKEFHTKGPKWNTNGKSIGDVLAAAPSTTKSSAVPPPPPPAPAAGGPPPPPPPPANLYDDLDADASATSGSGMQAVFAELNRGEGITSGLKKVDKSQMTHKNPELRKQAPPVPKKPTPPKKPASLSNSQASVPTKKPARKELVDGSKWMIENYTKSDLNGENLITIEVEMSQSIFIGKCDGITIQIKGKANAISVSNTSNCGFVVDSLISGFDLIKCHKFGLQILGTVADVSIDQCDEGSIYLSKESVEKDIQIYSSSTTALNINVPKEDDYVELAAPEQFKHSIKNGKLISEVLEHVA